MTSAPLILRLGGRSTLVPQADAALLGSTEGWQALLNLGGIANLLVPPAVAQTAMPQFGMGLRTGQQPD